MTNASLTDRQAMVSTPLALIVSALATKPGRCAMEQPGVNAPGSANSTTFLPLKMSSVEMLTGPSGPMVPSLHSGILSPVLMVMSVSPA